MRLRAYQNKTAIMQKEPTMTYWRPFCELFQKPSGVPRNNANLKSGTIVCNSKDSQTVMAKHCFHSTNQTIAGTTLRNNRHMIKLTLLGNTKVLLKVKVVIEYQI